MEYVYNVQIFVLLVLIEVHKKLLNLIHILLLLHTIKNIQEYVMKDLILI